MGLEVQVKRLLKGFELDAAFSVQAGTMGILGASGSGKSMTLRCVAGIEAPQEGRIALSGRVLYDASKGIALRPQERRVGYLFQNYALFPRMSVAENIGCALPREKRKKSVGALMERFQLLGLEKRYPGQLSGGQQQRVAVARCLAAAPEALLLDEPFSALDAGMREQMQLELQRMLQDFGGPVVLVTHDQREAYHLCQHLAVFDQGRCIAQGEIKALFAQPGLVQAARLMGCRNISRARSLGGNRLQALDWGVELLAAGSVPEDTAAVGVRENCLRPVGSPEGVNRFRFACLERLEEMDAYSAQVRLGDVQEAAPLWARLPKGGGLPAALSIAPEDVLLLKGEV